METLARIDPKRRAEIGRERRARTRAQLVEAARFLFTSRPIASVTVEDVTKQAGLAKGTFYAHFRQLDELWAAVAAELVETFADMADASRRSITDPVEVIAMGCAALHRRGSARSRLGSADRTRSLGVCTGCGRGPRAFENKFAIGPGQARLTCFSIDVGFDLVFGIVVQAMRSASEARLSPRDVPDIVQGILRALGVTPEGAERALRRVEHELGKWRRTLRKGQTSSTI
jgi:AcrR family transcriptional regulator